MKIHDNDEILKRNLNKFVELSRNVGVIEPQIFGLKSASVRIIQMHDKNTIPV